MRCLFAAGGLVAALSAIPADAAVVVVGNSLARSCYESARDQVLTKEALLECDAALNEVTLAFDDRVATHVNRGIIRMLRSDNARALSDYDRAMALDSDEPEAWLNKGILMVRMNRPKEAIELINIALTKKTQAEAIAYFARAIAHEDAGDLRSAYADYRRAHELEPKWQLPADELKRFRIVGATGSNA